LYAASFRYNTHQFSHSKTLKFKFRANRRASREERLEKIAEELSQPNEKRDAKQEEIQHTKARLGEVLKNKWKNKVMHGQYIRNIDR
jgi:predicted nuclease with TOPRIM domain